MAVIRICSFSEYERAPTLVRHLVLNLARQHTRALFISPRRHAAGLISATPALSRWPFPVAHQRRVGFQNPHDLGQAFTAGIPRRVNQYVTPFWI